MEGGEEAEEKGGKGDDGEAERKGWRNGGDAEGMQRREREKMSKGEQ